MKNESGFTLIELILVIAILGILAVAVAPQFVDIQDEAHIAKRDYTAANVTVGIQQVFSTNILNNNGAYPTTLDSAPNGDCVQRANPNQECFSLVLQAGLDQYWTKVSNTQYTHAPTNATFTYDPNIGTFVCNGC